MNQVHLIGIDKEKHPYYSTGSNIAPDFEYSALKWLALWGTDWPIVFDIGNIPAISSCRLRGPRSGHRELFKLHVHLAPCLTSQK